MKKTLTYFKNKYILAISVFVVYSLFLDDVDIFTVIRQNIKLSELESQKQQVQSDYIQTKSTLEKLKYTSGLEKYAREKKFFKKDDEDVFVISYE